MRQLILKKPVAIICILSLVFAAFIFIMGFRLSYSRQASQYTRTAAVGAEKMNLSLEKTQVIVQSIAWSKQLRSQDIEGIRWNIKRMHGLYPILHTIYVSNREGKVLLATADKVRADEVIYVDDRPYFQAAQAGHTAITGPIIPRGQSNTSYALLVSSPYYLDNGNFGGVVAAAVNIETLQKILSPDSKYDNQSMIALVSPLSGPIFTIGGELSDQERSDIHQQIVSNNAGVKQIAQYFSTFSLAPLSTSTPMWVAVVARPGVVRDLILHNLLLALLAAMVMAVAFGNVLNWNRRQREQEMEKKRQMAFIGEMAATIAHEIRNPLTYIKGKLSLDQEFGDEDNELLLEEVERIEAIVNEILLSAKPIPLMPEQAVLFDVVSEAVRIMMSLATEKGVTIQLINTGCDIIIKADRVQLRHVFINLVKNAIEAMVEPGLIIVTVDTTPEWALVTVQDAGEGMTEKELKQFGQVFYTTKKGGTGLGVSTCYRVVQAHQGQIEVTSTKGVGTRIKVFLPYISTSEVQ